MFSSNMFGSFFEECLDECDKDIEVFESWDLIVEDFGDFFMDFGDRFERAVWVCMRRWVSFMVLEKL